MKKAAAWALCVLWMMVIFMMSEMSGDVSGAQSGFVTELVERALASVRDLDGMARARGQTLAQMALAWVLRDPRVTSTLIGASSSAQIRENVAALQQLSFTPDELAAIDVQAREGHINLWEGPSRAV